ncbi:MAG TPA: hypothetical protein VIX35_12410, partial [Vicinamibacterales bacterium]
CIVRLHRLHARLRLGEARAIRSERGREPRDGVIVVDGYWHASTVPTEPVPLLSPQAEPAVPSQTTCADAPAGGEHG